MMSERAIIDKGDFKRTPRVSNAIGDLTDCIVYLREADTTTGGKGVLIYIPFAQPGDLVNDLQGE